VITTSLSRRLLFAGAALFVGLQLAGSAMAQNEKPPNAMGDINNNSGIITQGQTGNNTIIVGPSRLQFSTAIGEELFQKLPKGKPVRVRAIGSASDQAVAQQYGGFLQSKGVKIANWDQIAMLSPPPDGKLSITDTPTEVIVTIAPSAN
jgi:hypothetical protein